MFARYYTKSGARAQGALLAPRTAVEGSVRILTVVSTVVEGSVKILTVLATAAAVSGAARPT
ncbi:MAG: hypothetical protein IJQ34_05255 [Kiritimatiellae bacterium]|nr:hypothetical protein [Kiritimatiellia bacterium]